MYKILYFLNDICWHVNGPGVYCFLRIPLFILQYESRFKIAKKKRLNIRYINQGK